MNKKISFPIFIITIIILSGIVISTIYLLEYINKNNINLETFIKKDLSNEEEIIEEEIIEEEIIEEELIEEEITGEIKESLIIAIASLEDNKDGEISRQAGRAPFFVLFNGNGDFLEVIFNESATVEDGAGPSTAIMLAGKGVDIVIAGFIGENMAEELNNQEIRYYERQGEIEEVLNNILKII